MSERSGSGVGPFIFGIAIGAALGYLFAPAPGAESRRKLAGRWRDLKEFAGDEVDELKALVAETASDEGQEERDDADDEDARAELERRVAAARRRRRERQEPGRGKKGDGNGGGGGAMRQESEEDEPVA